MTGRTLYEVIDRTLTNTNARAHPDFDVPDDGTPNTDLIKYDDDVARAASYALVCMDKSTLLATMLGLVPGHERIVVVEDATELRPKQPRVVALQSRLSNIGRVGAITLRDLLRQALRMRPDRLIVGECRGAEVVDLSTDGK